MQLSAPLSALLSGGSIIDLDGTVFIQLALFAFAFAVLYALVFKPMVRLLDAREEAIEGSRADAKRIEADVESKRDDYEEQLRKVRASALLERDRLKSEGQRTERMVLGRVKVETHTTMADAQARLSAEAATARAELHAKVPMLGAAIATKILGREVRP